MGYTQKPVVTYSDPFDEPEGLDAKVFQCSNGSTMLLNFTRKSGIGVDIFNAKGKITTHADIAGSTLWDEGLMTKSKVCGIYNIGKDVVIFLEQIAKGHPIQYRLIVSADNGKLLKEDKIGEVSQVPMAATFNPVIQPKAFFVEKDPSSDAYAVLAYDGTYKGGVAGIKVSHYDGNPKKLGYAYFEGPATRFKHINCLGLAVDGEKAVYVCSYGFTTDRKTVEESALMLSTLTGKVLTHKEFALDLDFKETDAILAKNLKLNILELLFLAKIKSKADAEYYACGLIALDPAAAKTVYIKSVSTAPVSKFRTARYGVEKPYSGMPMNMVINEDGTTTVLMEEIELYGNINASTHFLRDIGVVDISETGEDTYGYAIRKYQQSKLGTPPLSHHDLRNNRVVFERMPGFSIDNSANPGFYSFDYFTAPAGRFIIYNDIDRNFDRDAEKDPKKFQSVSEGNTFCYRLKDGALSKFHLFGKPDDSFDNRVALITSGDYSEANNTYAVLIVEKKSRQKEAHIAWVHLQ